MIRLGLCCTFLDEPIKFRKTTAAYLSRIEHPYNHLDEIIRSNCAAVLEALHFCANHGIGCFRINSQLFPLCSHPDWKYKIEDLPSAETIFALGAKCRHFAEKAGMRLVLHPDQFVVLNSPRQEVVKNSIDELIYHGTLADLFGVDVINIHGGGAYGNKEEALFRFKTHFQQLPESVTSRLTLENDDKTYTPTDLLPLCESLSIPFVYDVHHHRCLKDHMLINEATEAAMKTWNREPLFHLSSPIAGWEGKDPYRHHDKIDFDDFPNYWKTLKTITIEVEAKAKEVAVLDLQHHLKQAGVSLWQKNSSA